MTGFSTALAVISLVLSVVACLLCARTAARAQELQDRLARSPTSRIQSLEQSLEETQEAMRVLANSVKMRNVRAAATHVPEKPKPADAIPDPHTDPDGWRNAMNRKLARDRLGL